LHRTKEFQRFHAWLARTYPLAHAALRRETVSEHSLLYTWEGTDAGLKPILLMAHQDVVPADERSWTVDPFAGVIRDGYVWGRGAWDNKSTLTAHFEAIELLLAQGFRPRQTVYLAYGHDEEVGGLQGAAQIAALLQRRGAQLDFVLDEGLVVTDGVLKGLTRPAALIGIAEKGYLSVVLRFPGTPGHSLMPPAKGTGAIAMMSAALRRIDDEQLPAGIRGVTREMFETLAPEMHGFSRIALSNLWLFSPLIQSQLEKSSTTNAMIRTTTAITMTQAGTKDNVLPSSAESTINFRLLPGDTREHVMQHVRARSKDARFELMALPGSSEASPVAPTASASWQHVAASVRTAFPDAVVAPGLVIGATDSRHFVNLSDHIYRFSPMRVRPDDLGRIHGNDERIGLENYRDMIRFFHTVLRCSGSCGNE
jgi:carboxypeptidase PM20D1